MQHPRQSKSGRPRADNPDLGTHRARHDLFPALPLPRRLALSSSFAGIVKSSRAAGNYK
jgi:hypothetical protein